MPEDDLLAFQVRRLRGRPIRQVSARLVTPRLREISEGSSYTALHGIGGEYPWCGSESWE